MDKDFWHQKWERQDIAFHEDDANPLLIKHFPRLQLAKHERIFLPLCGKTSAIGWLLQQGYRVAGSELSQIAVQQLFQDLGLKPKVQSSGHIEHYHAPNLDIYVGDIFELTPQILGKVDAIYDRAALVALPSEIRVRYGSHLVKLTQSAPQLLICYEYDQSQMPGPPFSISEREVRSYYQDVYQLTCLERMDVLGGLKGKLKAEESVWLLQTSLIRN